MEQREREQMNEKRAARNLRTSRENAEIGEANGLTSDQTTVLTVICAMRHEFHMNSDRIFNTETSESSDLWEAVDGGMNRRLASVDLPEIDFGEIRLDEIPTDQDYFCLLTDDERADYERRAEEEKYATGFGLWMDESGAFQEFTDAMQKIDEAIYNYLCGIDNRYGTYYASWLH